MVVKVQRGGEGSTWNPKKIIRLMIFHCLALQVSLELDNDFFPVFCGK